MTTPPLVDTVPTMKRILLIALVLAACGGEGPPTTADPTIHDTGWGRDVREITLSDGTLCVVARNVDAGIAITCNWRNG